MDLPKFLDKQGNSLVFNMPDSTFVFYVPMNYFSNTSKVPIATIVGQYVSTIGLFNWAIIDKNGKRGQLHTFYFPTMFLCKPDEMEKVKNLSLDGEDPSDYMLLKFTLGDEIVSECRVPQLIDNVEMTFKMSIMTAKIPNTIPYDKLWEVYMESASLNGFSYNLNIQLFGLLISRLCRDKNDLTKMFCETDMKDMTAYKLVDIRMVPKYISPYTAITSENWDEAVRAAVLMKDKDTPVSPLEKIITM